MPTSTVLLSLLATAFSVSAVPLQARDTYDTSGYCLEPVKHDTALHGSCGVYGSLKNPNIADYYPAFNAHECAQRCYSVSCTSFSIQPSTDNVNPGRCNLYASSLTTMGFRKSKTSTTAYYASACYTPQTTQDNPVQDGLFSNSGSPVSDPWIGSGDVNTDNSAEVAQLDAFASSPSSGSSPVASIRETMKTCPGEVYKFEYADADYYDFKGWLAILVNGNVLYNKTSADGFGAARTPEYFTSEGSTVQLEIFLDASRAGERAYERMDFLQAHAVYRGSLAPGTTIVQA